MRKYQVTLHKAKINGSAKTHKIKVTWVTTKTTRDHRCSACDVLIKAGSVAWTRRRLDYLHGNCIYAYEQAKPRAVKLKGQIPKLLCPRIKSTSGSRK